MVKNLLVILLTLAAAATPVRAQEVRLKAHHMLPPVAPGHTMMLAPWVEKVQADSGGRLQIDIYPSMHLGGQAPALIDQAYDGIVDIAWTLPGYTPGRFPRIEVFELPFLAAHPVVMNFAIQDLSTSSGRFQGHKLISVSFTRAAHSLQGADPLHRRTGRPQVPDSHACCGMDGGVLGRNGDWHDRSEDPGNALQGHRRRNPDSV